MKEQTTATRHVPRGCAWSKAFTHTYTHTHIVWCRCGAKQNCPCSTTQNAGSWNVSHGSHVVQRPFGFHCERRKHAHANFDWGLPSEGSHKGLRWPFTCMVSKDRWQWQSIHRHTHSFAWYFVQDLSVFRDTAFCDFERCWLSLNSQSCHWMKLDGNCDSLS